MSSPVWVYYTPGKSIEVCLKGADLDHADHGCQRAEYDEAAAIIHRSTLAFGRIYEVSGKRVLALSSEEAGVSEQVRRVVVHRAEPGPEGRFDIWNGEYDEQVEVQ